MYGIILPSISANGPLNRFSALFSSPHIFPSSIMVLTEALFKEGISPPVKSSKQSEKAKHRRMQDLVNTILCYN